MLKKADLGLPRGGDRAADWKSLGGGSEHSIPSLLTSRFLDGLERRRQNGPLGSFDSVRVRARPFTTAAGTDGRGRRNLSGGSQGGHRDRTPRVPRVARRIKTRRVACTKEGRCRVFFAWIKTKYDIKTPGRTAKLSAAHVLRTTWHDNSLPAAAPNFTAGSATHHRIPNPPFICFKIYSSPLARGPR